MDVGSEFQATWVRRGSFTGRVECWTDEPSCRDVQLNGYILPDIVPQGTIGLGLVQLEPVCQMDPEKEFPNIVQKRKLQYLSHLIVAQNISTNVFFRGSFNGKRSRGRPKRRLGDMTLPQ